MPTDSFSRLIRRLWPGRPYRWAEVDDLANWLKEEGRVVVVDVRGPDEFTGPLGHIAGAQNLPIEQLPNRIHELETLKDRLVVLVCRTDKRSAMAAASLQAAGFRDVRVLRGGMQQWNRDGLAVA
jgi:rhodanese-related sulfurtransferase